MKKSKLIKLSKKDIEYFRKNPPKVIYMVDEDNNQWKDIWIDSRKVYKMTKKSSDSNKFYSQGEHNLEDYIYHYLNEETPHIQDNWLRQGIKEAIFKQQINEIIKDE